MLRLNINSPIGETLIPDSLGDECPSLWRPGHGESVMIVNVWPQQGNGGTHALGTSFQSHNLSRPYAALFVGRFLLSASCDIPNVPALLLRSPERMTGKTGMS
jgi:hypothetical protein